MLFLRYNYGSIDLSLSRLVLCKMLQKTRSKNRGGERMSLLWIDFKKNGEVAGSLWYPLRYVIPKERKKK